MAGFGAKHPCFAPMTSETDSGNSYGAGIVLGKLVSANFTVTTATGELWADDYKAESAEEIAGGQLVLETDSLTDAKAAVIYGAQADGDTYVYSTADNRPYGGVGYYQVLQRGGVKYYRAYFVPKCRAQVTGDTAQTKGSSITFTAETTTFAVEVPLDGKWREVETFASESAALAWVESKCAVATWYNVVIGVSGAGSVDAGTYAAAAGDNYVVDFGDDAPTVVYDNGSDVTSSISDGKYTISSIAADHNIVVVF